MAVGLATSLANALVNFIRGVAGTPPAAEWVQLHTADPGAAGTTAAAAGSTARSQATHAAGAGGAIALTGTKPSWTNGGTSETITHVSVWDASTAGNLLYTAVLATPRAWAATDILNLNTLGVSLAPLAA